MVFLFMQPFVYAYFPVIFCTSALTLKTHLHFSCVKPRAYMRFLELIARCMCHARRFSH